MHTWYYLSIHFTQVVPGSRENYSNTGIILIGELCFPNLQSLEIVGDMYQGTEAFCHYS